MKRGRVGEKEEGSVEWGGRRRRDGGREMKTGSGSGGE
jgi:hypothetical protein